MTRYKSRVFLAALLLTLLVACSKSEQSESSAAADASMETASAPASAASASELSKPESGDSAHDVQREGVDAGQLASTANTVTDPRRRFVRTAQADFQVKDVYASTLAIEDAVAAEGGFVVRNTISTSEYGRIQRPIGNGKLLQLSQVATQGSLVIRVPSERTQAFLRVIAKQMQFLDTRTFEASDVQFDLLRQQLAYARAQTLQQDIRDAGAQPARTGEKIDAVQAREQMLAARDEATVSRRELEDRIAFSTLTLTLKQPAQVREQTVPDTEAILRERGPGFFAAVVEGLSAGWRGLLALIVAAIHVWPLWLMLVAGGWLVIRIRRGRTGRAAAAPREIPPVP